MCFIGLPRGFLGWALGMSTFPLLWAQQMTVEFVRHYAAAGMTGGLGSVALPDGSVAITGQFDFSGCKTWVARVGACGNPLWVVLIQDASGGTALTYVEGGRIGVGSRGRIHLLDMATGNLIWSRNHPGGYVEDIANDPYTDRILLIPYDPGGYVYSLDYGGNLVWSRRLFPSSDGKVYQLLVLPHDTTYLLCGAISNQGTGGTDILLVKMNPMGTVLWARAYGTPGNEGEIVSSPFRLRAVSCALSPDRREVFIAARTSSVLPGGGGWDVLVVRADTSGNLIWANVYGGPSSEDPKGIAITPQWRIGVMGEIPGDRAFVLVIDSAGTYLSTYEYLWNGDTDGVGIDAVPDGTFVVNLYANFPGTGDDALLVKTDTLGRAPCGATPVNWSTASLALTTTFVSVFPQAGPGISAVSYSQVVPPVQDAFLCISCSQVSPPSVQILPQDTFCTTDTPIIVFITDTSGESCIERRIDGNIVWDDTVAIPFPPGMHIVEIFAICGQLQASARDTFWVLPAPKPSIPDTFACQYDSLYLSISVTGGVPPYSNYQWNPPQHVSCPSCPSSWVYVNDTLELIISVEDAYGCRGKDTVEIIAKPLPELQPAATQPICQGDTFILNLNVSGGNGGFTFSVQAPTGATYSTETVVLYPADTAYTGWWTLIVEDSLGCRDSQVVYLEISPRPVAQIDGNPEVCDGDTLTLNAIVSSGTTPYSYMWATSGWIQCPACDSTRIFLPSSATVTLIVEDSLSCRDTATLFVTVHPLPVFDLPDTVLCLGDTMTRRIPTGVQWIWEPAEWTSCDTCRRTRLFPTYTQTFTATAISSEGCIYTDYFLVQIDSGAPVRILTCDSILPPGTQTQLTGFTTGVQWWWTSPDNGTILSPFTAMSVSVMAPVQEYTQDTFVFWAATIHGCLTQDTCIITAVEVPCDSDLWVPNAFTPNGDGKNDVLYVYSINPMRIIEWNIYTRWGEKVFSVRDVQTGYPLMRSVVGWDGTYQGKPLRSDVYVYYIIAECGRYRIFRKGDVTLIR